jgi:uncharacterized protein (TIGR03435 family)
MKTLTMMFTLTALAMGQAFEVASIKPSDPGTTGFRIGIEPGGVFTARNVTLKIMIEQAFEVRDFQISGGPGWMDTQMYDITAKGNGPEVSEYELARMTDEQRNRFQQSMLARLRTLLADRFQLKVHKETKEMPVYALVVAKGGPKIVKSGDSFGPQSGLKGQRTTEGKTQLTGTQFPLSSLVRALSNQVGRVVIDKTGLTGNFDFKMTYAPDLADSDGPSIFTALEEQLGLKLDSQKGPVEVLVIDGAERASEN